METLQKLRSLELYLSAHPDCEINSECADRLSDVQELLKEIPDNSYQIEKLEADKAELLEALETTRIALKKWNDELSYDIYDLIQKHKQ